jgi:putative membrane protein
MARRMRQTRRSGDTGNVVAGVVAGLIGGLAGTWTMTHFQAMWSRASGDHDPDTASSGGRHDARDWQERIEGSNANELAANAIARRAIDRPLTRQELEKAAPALHYAFGAAMGAIYGGLRAVSPAVRGMGGSGWGTTVWAAADGIGVPLLGLSRPKSEYPLESHAQSYAAHLVYGVTTEVVRRGVCTLLN